jgi:tyrosine-protein kinase Etk/Wzc
VAMLLPTQFTAETRILPPQQNQSAATALVTSLVGGLGPLGSLATKDLGLKSPNDLYVGLLKARPVADALIRRFDLMKRYGAKDMTAARIRLASQTDVHEEKDSMISISVQNRDKKLATLMANAYVEELRNLSKGLALTEASQRRLFYEEQLKQAKEDLSAAEVGLQQAQTKSGMIQLDAQAKVIIETIGNLRARIAAKRVELQALRSFATSQNAQVGIAESELAGMESELRRMERQSGGADNFDLSLKNVPQAGLEYVRAYREVKYRETLFEILAKQYEIARLDEARDAIVIQVVAPAIEPDRKSFPPRTVITVLSAFAGLFLGCLLVMISQWKTEVEANPARASRLRALREAILSR